MYRSTPSLPVAVAFTLWAGAAQADQFTDTVVTKFQELGFDYIEVKEGISQLKVEAIQGSQKYEVIYDRETGKILKQETERADAGEIGKSGVDIDRRSRDFLSADDLDDERDGDEMDDDESSQSDGSDSDETDDDEDDEDTQSDESDDDEDDDESDDDESDEADDEDSDESDDDENDESDDED